MMLHFRAHHAKGTPTKRGKQLMVVCRFTPEMLAEINARASAGKLSTAEIVRRLVERGLQAAKETA